MHRYHMAATRPPTQLHSRRNTSRKEWYHAQTLFAHPIRGPEANQNVGVNATDLVRVIAAEAYAIWQLEDTLAMNERGGCASVCVATTCAAGGSTHDDRSLVVLKHGCKLLRRRPCASVHEHQKRSAPNSLFKVILGRTEYKRSPGFPMKLHRVGFRKESRRIERGSQPLAIGTMTRPERRRRTGCAGLSPRSFSNEHSW